MKLGFALKKTKKSVLQGGGVAGAQGANGAATSAVAGVFASALPAKQSVEKVFVTDFDPNARATVEFDKDGNVKTTLVIPLIKANAWKGDEEESGSSGDTGAKSTLPADDEPMLTADELAAKELLADAKSQAGGGGKSGSSSSHAADLVIPMNGKPQEEGDDKSSADTKSHTQKKKEHEEDEKTREMKAKLFNFESQEKNRKKQHLGSDALPSAPILQQNVVPGMDALEDVNEKYRLDVSMRPDELDVHSSAYDMVPIEDFGAALLRGMGWKGNVDTDDKGAEPKPRYKLLGLGATIRPPIPGESKNKHRKKPSYSQQQQSSSGQPRGKNSKEDDNKSRHSGLNHTEASSNSKDQKQRASRSPSPRRSGDRTSRHSGSSKRDSRDRHRSSSRDRRSSRDDKEDRPRRRDDERHASQSSSRRRSRSNDRKSTRDRESEKRSDHGDRHRDDDRRKRSRSRERSSDRKRSSRR